jgi:hypothetical protein
VPPPDRWLGHVSRADRAADRWPGRPLAHRTVRCTPDSPVNYSRMPPMKSREQRVRTSQPGAPDTVRCTTGQSGAPRLSRVLAARAKTFPIVVFLCPPHCIDQHKSTCVGTQSPKYLEMAQGHISLSLVFRQVSRSSIPYQYNIPNYSIILHKLN